MHLCHLTDRVLLQETKSLAKTERDLSIKVLHHLKEFERRRLFSDLRYGSLFEYTVKELGYSEPEAARRLSQLGYWKRCRRSRKRLKKEFWI